MNSESPRVALDISLYHHSSPEIVATDMASLVREATRTSKSLDPDRIWWFDHLPTSYSLTAPDFPVTLAALDLERLINSTPESSQRLILLTSPAYGYPESRLDVYFVDHTSSRGITFDAYGIPIRESAESTENRLTQFILRSDTPGLPHLSGSDAVMTPISATLQGNEDIYQTARLWIDLPPDVWDQIQFGEIKSHCQELTKAMTPIAIALQSELIAGKNPYSVGAAAEVSLAQTSGIDMDFAGSGCGVSNFEFLTPASSQGGDIPEAIFVRHCGVCCGLINRPMLPGEACPHPNCRKIFIGSKTVSPQIQAQPDSVVQPILPGPEDPSFAWDPFPGIWIFTWLNSLSAA